MTLSTAQYLGVCVCVCVCVCVVRNERLNKLFRNGVNVVVNTRTLITHMLAAA